MSTGLYCFFATFVSVFALGLQSQNVNQGHYVAAGATSILIGVSTMYLYRYMPDAGFAETLGYLGGGVSGILFSMWFHRSVKAWWGQRLERARARWERERIRRGGCRQPGCDSPAQSDGYCPWHQAPHHRAQRGQVPPKAPPPRPCTKLACRACGMPAGASCPRLVCERYDEHADVYSPYLH